MTMTCEWVCPSCAYSTTQQISFCPLCQIPLARKAGTRTRGPAAEGVERRGDLKRRQPQATGCS